MNQRKREASRNRKIQGERKFQGEVSLMRGNKKKKIWRERGAERDGKKLFGRNVELLGSA